jgi:hypothetical protein
MQTGLRQRPAKRGARLSGADHDGVISLLCAHKVLLGLSVGFGDGKEVSQYVTEGVPVTSAR